MSKKFVPFLAHSEITDCIYIIDKNDKYEVTEQCIKAMKATNRMPNVGDVLEKIRAEIAKYDEVIGHHAQVQWCLNVIDKYKTESEGVDADNN